MFKAITQSIASISNIIVKACLTVEDMIGLVHNEVTNLGEEQQIRLDEITAERLNAQAERMKAEKSVTRSKAKSKTKVES